MSEETKTLSPAERQANREDAQAQEEMDNAEFLAKNHLDGTEDRILKYPISDINRYGARIVFMPKLITGPKLDGNMGIGDLLMTMTKGLASVVMDIADGDTDSAKEKLDSGPQIKPGVNLPLPLKKMEIYLPISLSSTDGLTYDSPSIGASGAILSNALTNAEGSAGGALGNATADFINLFKGAGGVSANSLASLGAARLASKGPKEIGDGVASSLRVTVDPNIRTLFRGVQVRQFAYQFKFIAKNSKEAQEIKKIIQRFRFYAYPESIAFAGTSGADISVGFKYPHPFEIRASYIDADGNSFRVGPLMKDAYLTSITTNFNPSTMSFHQDGEPVEIDLSLSFTEETTLSKKDILKGY